MILNPNIIHFEKLVGKSMINDEGIFNPNANSLTSFDIDKSCQIVTPMSSLKFEFSKYEPQLVNKLVRTPEEKSRL